MGEPCVLFASCSSTKPGDLVKQILSVEKLPLGKNLVEDVFAYDWEIQNKYYTAKVALCATESRTIGDAEFADSVEAFVIHFDSTQTDSFKQVKCWVPYLKQLEPDILMLVCNTCSTTDAVDRLTAQKFCIEHGFELIELQPEETSDSEEDEFKETTGIQRIIQALHAHTWPNLKLKDNPDVRSAYIHQLMQDEMKAKADGLSLGLSTSDDEFQDFVSCENGASIDPVTQDLTNASDSQNGTEFTQKDSQSLDKSEQCVQRTTGNGDNDCSADSVSETSNTCSGANTDEKEDRNTCSGATADEKKDETKTSSSKDSPKASRVLTSEERIDSLLGNDDMSLFAALGNEDPGGESFEELFEKLRVMKERADGLPLEERKAYAEKVAVSFWKAIGGDEEEIDGLADSDSD